LRDAKAGIGKNLLTFDDGAEGKEIHACGSDLFAIEFVGEDGRLMTPRLKSKG
jgi:hypothetical protein